MTSLINLELTEMKAEELRAIAKEYKMTGAWKAKKQEMIDFLEVKKSEQIKEQEELQTQKPQQEDRPRRGRTKTIEVYKNGELIETIDGLLNTFRWAKENDITNQGWVKRSLKTGEETTSGWRYKEGGYIFKYADK